MARKFFAGVNQAVTSAFQWFSSEDQWATVDQQVAPPAAHAAVAPAIQIFDGSLGERGATSSDGRKFFYPGTYTVGNAQPIRVWDADTETDTQLCTIPINSQAFSDIGAGPYVTWGGKGIRQMLHHDNKLFIVSADVFWPGGAGSYSRIMVYDFDAATVSQVGNFFSGWTNAIGDTSSGGATGGSSGLVWCVGIHDGFGLHMSRAGGAPRS